MSKEYVFQIESHSSKCFRSYSNFSWFWDCQQSAGQYFIHFLIGDIVHATDFLDIVFHNFWSTHQVLLNDIRICESFRDWIFADCKSDDVIIRNLEVPQLPPMIFEAKVIWTIYSNQKISLDKIKSAIIVWPELDEKAIHCMYQVTYMCDATCKTNLSNIFLHKIPSETGTQPKVFLCCAQTNSKTIKGFSAQLFYNLSIRVRGRVVIPSLVSPPMV